MSSDGAPRSARPSLLSVVSSTPRPRKQSRFQNTHHLSKAVRLLGDPEVKFHILDVTLAFVWHFFPQKEEKGVGSREEGKWVDKKA